jgi:hypothetical protein
VETSLDSLLRGGRCGGGFGGSACRIMGDASDMDLSGLVVVVVVVVVVVIVAEAAVVVPWYGGCG